MHCAVDILMYTMCSMNASLNKEIINVNLNKEKIKIFIFILYKGNNFCDLLFVYLRTKPPLKSGLL